MWSAVFNDVGGNVSIINSTFTNNNASMCGAIYNHGNMSINTSNLMQNTAGYAGAIYSHNNELNIFNSNITNNSANNGGALYSNGSVINVTGCDISNNNAVNVSGGNVIALGGISSIFNATNCSFNNNGNVSGRNNFAVTDDAKNNLDLNDNLYGILQLDDDISIDNYLAFVATDIRIKSINGSYYLVFAVVLNSYYSNETFNEIWNLNDVPNVVLQVLANGKYYLNGIEKDYIPFDYIRGNSTFYVSMNTHDYLTNIDLFVDDDSFTMINMDDMNLNHSGGSISGTGNITIPSGFIGGNGNNNISINSSQNITIYGQEEGSSAITCYINNWLFKIYSGNLTLVNIILTNSRGLFNYGGDFNLVNCTIINNNGAIRVMEH